MKEKSLNFIIPLVIYPFDVMVSIAEADSQMAKHIKTYGLIGDGWQIDETPYVAGRAFRFEGGQTLIRIRAFPETNFDYAIIQHEIFHAVTFIMDRIGIQLQLMVSDEAYAYLIQYLTNKIYDRL